MRLLNNTKPFVALLMLLFLILAVGIALSSVGVLIGYLIYGSSVIDISVEASVGQMKYMQMLTQITFFIAPALLYAFLMQRNILAYFKLQSLPQLRYWVMAIALVFLAMPFNEALVHLNQHMHLPQVLSEVEAWMRASEERANVLMAQFLKMNNLGDYFVNLIMIALLAAVGEELLMRGVLQPLLVRWTASIHWGIWITAFVFSFIHLQFYGFFARMFLGAVFGYLYVYTSNLWLPIVAHFFNNAAAVSFVYFTGLQIEDMSTTAASNTTLMWFLAPFSLVAVMVVLWYLKREEVRT